MIDLLAAQSNYFTALTAAACLLLSALCISLGRRRDDRLAWNWLTAFGLFYACDAAVELWARLSAAATHCAVAETMLCAAGLACLAEFGRRGFTFGGGTIRPSRLYPACLALASLGAWCGEVNGIEATWRYAVGLPGGLLAGLALLQAAKQRADGRPAPLRFAAGAMLVFTLIAGLVAPKAGVFPASHVNDESFLAAVGLPVHAIEAFCLVVILADLCYFGRTLSSAGGEWLYARRRVPQIMGLAVLAAWFVLPNDHPTAAAAAALHSAESAVAPHSAELSAWRAASTCPQVLVAATSESKACPEHAIRRGVAVLLINLGLILGGVILYRIFRIMHGCDPAHGSGRC